MWSHDEFMFKQFEIHVEYRRGSKKNKDNYFEISSGTNKFPMPKVVIEAHNAELNGHFFYGYYTSPKGFPPIATAAKMYEDFISFGNLTQRNNDVCIAQGASQAASLVFDYLKNTEYSVEVIDIGRSYSLYDRLARKNGYSYTQCVSKRADRTIPSPTELKDCKPISANPVFIYIHPNNPSGERYNREEFREIMEYVKSVNGYMILDMVCDIVITKGSYLPIQSLITEFDYWDKCAVVNSFSKTDSTAGMRFGYVYGNSDLIETASNIQGKSMMSQPTIPAVSMFLIFLFRCVFISERLNKLKQDRNYICNTFKFEFYRTASEVGVEKELYDEMESYMDSIFSVFSGYYDSYIAEQLENESIILDNHEYLLKTLLPFVNLYTSMESGFNFLIRFNTVFKINELALTQQIINKTGVAVLTESAFSHIPCTDGKYFFRFSLACKKVSFRNAVDRFRTFLEDVSKVID